MNQKELLIAGFERISGTLERTLEALTVEDLNFQSKPDSNSMGWLAWHLTRWQDFQTSSSLKKEQLWIEQGWNKKFSQPADANDTGMGHKEEDLAKYKSPDAATLIAYNKAVLERLKEYVSTLSDSDLDKVVEGTPIKPPPTVGLMVIGLWSDGMQHMGQIGYVRGLLQGMGWH
ncbi:DinB family protein [Chloroflexota bacterium]